MKSLLKIIFVGVVILGLVASYVFIGTPAPVNKSASSNFEGPKEPPPGN